MQKSENPTITMNKKISNKKRKCFKHSKNVPVAIFNETRYNKYANFEMKDLLYSIRYVNRTIYDI